MGMFFFRPLFAGLVLAGMFLAAPGPEAGAASPEEAFAQAQAAYGAGRLEEAAGRFSEAANMLARAGQHDKARMVLGNVGVILIKLERYEDAAAAYDKALGLPGRVLPEFRSKACRNLAVCRSRLEQHALRAQALEQLLKTAPKLKTKLAPADLADIHARLGDAYRALELYRKAVAAYGQAASLLPEDAPAAERGRLFTAMGLCEGNLGEFEQAAGHLKMAGDLAAVSGEALTKTEAASNLGILYWERGDHAEASRLLEAALANSKEAGLRRNEGVDRNNLGLVWKSAGRYADATAAFADAVAIAREVGNKRDEAIALANRALVARIQGRLADAGKDYAAALDLYAAVSFREGRAGALMGLGRVSEIEDHNLAEALARYTEALAIYRELEMPRGTAEALIQIGRVYDKAATPQRTTRDLVYDEEDVSLPPVSPERARAEAEKAYAGALELSGALGAGELIWSAEQGLGHVLFLSGKPKEAIKHYKKAIALVASLRGDPSTTELLGEYMQGKDDLFTEAMEVCAALYAATGDKAWLSLQMQYDATLRNEVARGSMAAVRMQYADPKKQDLYARIIELGRQQDKAEKAVPAAASGPRDADPEGKARQALLKAEADRQRAKARTLAQSYEQLLAQWKKSYPADAMLFDTAARVDTARIQAMLAPDQALLHYIALPDELIIMAVSKNDVRLASVPVPRKALNSLVRDDFIYNNIEKYGHASQPAPDREQAFYASCLDVLGRLHELLIAPVQDAVRGKKRLYVVSSGYLAQVPFGALVTSMENGVPHFLVESFEISNFRTSFLDAPDGKGPSTRPSTRSPGGQESRDAKRMLGAGDPRNSHLTAGLGSLPAARAEMEAAARAGGLEAAPDRFDLRFGGEATEAWWRSALARNRYETLYFATHGMPYSDTYVAYYVAYPKQRQKWMEEEGGEKRIAVWDRQKAFMEQALPGLTPLNGYLLLAAPADAPESGADGLLTLKEVAELPENDLSGVRYAVLSACNTGVTFAPKSFGGEETEKLFSTAQVEAELRKAGWTPGVDQISFVDTFMRRGLTNVYGTLWFADDEASSRILSRFMQGLQKGDAVAAFSATQREYIAAAKNGEAVLGPGYTTVPLHPYYWAVGAVFGK